MKTINGLEIKPWADLRSADLRSADLLGANLTGADLRSADLTYANLTGANLYGANLRSADLLGANLTDANLTDANLRSADLRSADLRGANLRGAKNIPFIPQLEILAEGDIIGYKKCREGVVKLLIPIDAKRSSSTGRKCRAEYAIVLETPGGKVATSCHDSFFEYHVGMTVRPTRPFCEDRWDECSSGIHFFITRKEAEDYK